MRCIPGLRIENWCGDSPGQAIMSGDPLFSARPQLAAGLSHRGFVFASRYRPDLDTVATAASLGGVLQKIQGVPIVQRLVPRSIEKSAPNVYSGNFGLSAFPLHTDLAHWFSPPRFLMLRCLRGDSGVTSYILPWNQALNGFAHSKTTRARFRPRRALNGRLYLLPFCVTLHGVELRRWDSLFLKPDNTEADELAQHLKLGTNSTTNLVFRDPGDTLIIDNWRVLHGRSGVSLRKSTRLVERVYLQEIFADG